MHARSASRAIRANDPETYTQCITHMRSALHMIVSMASILANFRGIDFGTHRVIFESDQMARPTLTKSVFMGSA